MEGWIESIWNLLQQLKALYLHFYNDYGYQTWLGCDLPWERPNHKVTWRFDHVVLQDHLANESHYISIIRVYIATKLGRIVAYFDVLLLLYSSDSLITWSCYITWQAKNISLAPQYLWPPILARWWHTHSKNYIILQSRSFVRSRDLLNTLYLHLHWTWEIGESP